MAMAGKISPTKGTKIEGKETEVIEKLLSCIKE